MSRRRGDGGGKKTEKGRADERTRPGGLNRGGDRTFLVVELPEDLADDLTHALQRLEVVFRLVEGLLRLLHLVAQTAHLGVELLGSGGRSRRGGGERRARRALKTKDANAREIAAGGARAGGTGRPRGR